MKVFRILFIAILFLFLPQVSFADSNYVLPYPTSMPGSLAYKFHLVFENVKKYWYFGSFGQFDYSLKMADKYLVEAKTLFDYRQYLLGIRALEKSNMYFKEALPILKKAEKTGKNISQKRSILKAASQKHIEYLEEIDINTPDVFVWEPEKSLPTTLLLKKTIVDSIDIRKDSL